MTDKQRQSDNMLRIPFKAYRGGILQSKASISKQLVILAETTVQLAVPSFLCCKTRLPSARQAIVVLGGHSLLQVHRRSGVLPRVVPDTTVHAEIKPS